MPSAIDAAHGDVVSVAALTSTSRRSSGAALLGTRRQLSDWILVASVLAGMFVSLGLGALSLALIVRGRWNKPDWRLEHTILSFAAAWALLVLAVRGTPDGAGTLPYFVFLWVFPILLAAYRPDEQTVHRFGVMLIGLFVVDLFFNVHILVVGHDLLGRSLDGRDAVVGGRLGGIFAHSFYSGAISVAALLTVFSRRRMGFLSALAIGNLILAGSWRFSAAIIIAALFALRWRRRSRPVEVAMIVVVSLVIVAGVVATSGLVDASVEVNPSNNFRVFAWVTSIERIAESPWFGVGFPNENAMRDAGVSFETMEEHLISESWYLGSAITFGIPYTLLYLAAFGVAFYGRRYGRRDMTRAVLYPFVLVDLTYGSFFGSILIYSWLWLLILADPPGRDIGNRSGLAVAIGPRRPNLT